MLMFTKHISTSKMSSSLAVKNKKTLTLTRPPSKLVPSSIVNTRFSRILWRHPKRLSPGMTLGTLTEPLKNGSVTAKCVQTNPTQSAPVSVTTNTPGSRCVYSITTIRPTNIWWKSATQGSKSTWHAFLCSSTLKIQAISVSVWTCARLVLRTVWLS